MAQPPKHRIETRPAPIGGLNGRDPISAMPEGDAVNLVNWIPAEFGLQARKGWREWATGLGRAVGGVAAWVGTSTPYPPDTSTPTAVPGKLYCTTDLGIYDITSQTAAPTLAVAFSATDGAGWTHSTMFTNTAGSFLCLTSEIDGYHYFDGLTWTKPPFGSGPGHIQNIDPTDLCFVTSWKRRLWFVETNSTRAWYLPTDSITGSATAFDFGPQFPHGGSLSYLARWTLDAGEGIDDFLVAVSSTGDVAVYKGTDPASASTFGLVGSWYIGQIPAGRRGFCQYGGDLLLLSTDGINPISYVTRGGQGTLATDGKEYSSKIRNPLGADLRRSFTQKGWQLATHPTERMLICSVPNTTDAREKQYAMSTTVNTWTYFSGIPVYCMGTTLSYMFAGTEDGRVLLLFNDYTDAIPLGGTEGNPVRGVVQPAFSYFGSPARNKIFLMARAVFLSEVTPQILLNVNVNFNTQAPGGTPAYSIITGAAWDAAIWDTDVWSGGLSVAADWVGVGGVGFAGAAALVVNSTGPTTLTSVDYMLHDGGPL